MGLGWICERELREGLVGGTAPAAKPSFATGTAFGRERLACLFETGADIVPAPVSVLDREAEINGATPRTFPAGAEILW